MLLLFYLLKKKMTTNLSFWDCYYFNDIILDDDNHFQSLDVDIHCKALTKIISFLKKWKYFRIPPLQQQLKELRKMKFHNALCVSFFKKWFYQRLESFEIRYTIKQIAESYKILQILLLKPQFNNDCEFKKTAFRLLTKHMRKVSTGQAVQCCNFKQWLEFSDPNNLIKQLKNLAKNEHIYATLQGHLVDCESDEEDENEEENEIE